MDGVDTVGAVPPRPSLFCSAAIWPFFGPDPSVNVLVDDVVEDVEEASVETDAEKSDLPPRERTVFLDIVYE